MYSEGATLKATTYTIRRQKYRDRDVDSYSVTIPREIAERLLAAGQFELQLMVTNEGLLYRVPAKTDEPAWLQNLK